MQTPLVDARSYGAALPVVGLPLPVVSGDASRLPVGELLAAIVHPIGNGQAKLELPGQNLTVRMPFSVAEQSQLLIRLSAQGQQSVEVVGQLFPQSSGSAARAGSNASLQNATLQSAGDGRFTIDVRGESVPLQAQYLRNGESVLIRWIAQPSLPRARTSSDAASANQSFGQTIAAANSKSQVVQLEVLDVLPDGRLNVLIDGKQRIAVSSEPFGSGAKMIALAEATSTGWRIQPLQAGEASATEIATAMLRSDPQTGTIGSSLRSLLNSLQAGDAESSTLLQQIVARLVPENGKSPSSEQMIAFLRDGGLTYEAKLGRQIDSTQAGDAFREISQRDLKGQILELLRGSTAAKPEATTSGALDAARSTLRSIEAQQAVNLIAQAQNGVFQLQIPLANPSQWETLRVSYQADNPRSGTEDDRPQGYDLLMHVSLTETGETWIDARVSGKQMRAVLYLEKAEARAQARSEIGSLKASLTELGFERPLLDVRSTQDLPRGPAAVRFDSLRRSEPVSTTGVDRRA